MVLGVPWHVINMFELQKLGPLVQKPKFVQLRFLAISQNYSTCATHNLLNFYPMKVILDFFESSRCPLQSLCWSFFHLKSLSWCKFSWQKVSFCLLLKWPIMFWPISLKWSIFWPWAYRDNFVENCISFKISFVWEIYDEVCESYAW